VIIPRFRASLPRNINRSKSRPHFIDRCRTRRLVFCSRMRRLIPPILSSTSSVTRRCQVSATLV
jgi:hypothetical protein